MEYRLIRSGRRTLALEISREGEVIVRAPAATPLRDIEEFVAGHTAWIEKHKAKRKARSLPPLTEEEKRELRARALSYLPARTEYFASIMKIVHSGVKITSAKCRLGSCNVRRGISYSYRLMQYPEEVIDYVIVHELAHCKEMNHSPRFYAIIARYLPDYKARIHMMRTYPTAT